LDTTYQLGEPSLIPVRRCKKEEWQQKDFVSEFQMYFMQKMTKESFPNLAMKLPLALKNSLESLSNQPNTVTQ